MGARSSGTVLKCHRTAALRCAERSPNVSAISSSKACDTFGRGVAVPDGDTFTSSLPEAEGGSACELEGLSVGADGCVTLAGSPSLGLCVLVGLPLLVALV